MRGENNNVVDPAHKIAHLNAKANNSETESEIIEEPEVLIVQLQPFNDPIQEILEGQILPQHSLFELKTEILREKIENPLLPDQIPLKKSHLNPSEVQFGAQAKQYEIQ